MATDSTDVMSTATMATSLGLFVAAGLGAVYAYYANTHTQAGTQSEGKGKGEGEGGNSNPTRTKPNVKGDGENVGGGMSVSEPGKTSRKVRKKRVRGKGKDLGTGHGVGVDVDVDDSEGEDRGKGRRISQTPATAVPVPVVPGDFEGAASVTHNAQVAPDPAPNSGKAKKKRTRAKAKKQQANDEEGKEVGQGLCSGDSTDASASLVPSRSVSTSASALASSNPEMGNGDVSRADTTRLVAQSAQPHTQARVQALPTAQLREIRSSSLSLSLDTDSSWTHVDSRHRVKARVGESMGAADVTSSDVASTASDSPVVERMSGSATDNVRGTRRDVGQLTLAERLVPKPRKTVVDDMLEQPHAPPLARVMRVQPRSDDAPVPGFSWDDYGDVIEDEGSFVVHDTDADQEDEGEWGIVKSRSNRSRHTSTIAPSPTSPAPAPAGDSGTVTKKQRQNARRRDLAKAVKAEAETARLDGLAKHKRELERLRIIEQSQQGGGRKRPSGGMHVTVDERGKLVWE